MVVFTFPVLKSEIPFLGKFGSKNQNFQFTLKFGNQTSSNMQNSSMGFNFAILDQAYPFWENLIQKIKIVSLGWNLFYLFV